jgi:hypothetical protein
MRSTHPPKRERKRSRSASSLSLPLLLLLLLLLLSLSTARKTTAPSSPFKLRLIANKPVAPSPAGAPHVFKTMRSTHPQSKMRGCCCFSSSSSSSGLCNHALLTSTSTGGGEGLARKPCSVDTSGNPTRHGITVRRDRAPRLLSWDLLSPAPQSHLLCRLICLDCRRGAVKVHPHLPNP